MREQLRRLLFTAKIYQFCADIFAIFGVCLFAYIYFENYRNNPAAAIKDPFFVVTILLPFIPAALMAWMAAKERKKIKALIESQAEAP